MDLDEIIGTTLKGMWIILILPFSPILLIGWILGKIYEKFFEG